MATLPTQSFTAIVTNTVAGIQGRASKLVNFTIGSTLRAIAEGFAGLFLWFQAMVLLVLKASRLTTSEGVDVDTFTADFMEPVGISNGVQSPRLGAEAATGQVTYSRFTAAPTTCFIPAAASVTADGVVTNAGAQNAATIQTSDRSQNFVVIADTTNANYSATLGGYTLASSVASIIVPVSAMIAGGAGNVQAGTLTVMTSAITGMDAVTNVAAFTNGADKEQDTPLKRRFAAYILGLSRGDYYGTAASLLGVAVNVQWTLTEGYNLDGSWHPGFYFIVADDGSGNPPLSFMQRIADAANAVRPLGMQCAVFNPSIILANVGMQVPTLPGYDHSTVVAQVAAQIATNINSLGLGKKLPWSILASWAYSVPGVDKDTGVSAVTLNGATGDGASINPTRRTQDGYGTIAYATVKAGVMSIS
ncbi:MULTISPECIES: baseplate J/gp47 family protein [unclassified Bradyrhizobium]|uniref:baseplate J/gp47 family protein n=1 Tax=unclassified Bradyrhizobium TaxID=2631580 RepID=UPI0028EB8C26|nr:MULTISPECIES: baseplate J/gp47 family protein [unclassified Bradyrhizobium]